MRRATNIAEAVTAGAGRGDVWIPPTVLDDAEPIRSGDAVVFTNFRSDRTQQLADGLVDHLAAASRHVVVASLAQYDTKAPIPALVARADAIGGLADELQAHGCARYA